MTNESRCIPDLDAPPKSASDEAFQRVYQALQYSEKEYKALPFFAFFKRYTVRGSIIALTLVLSMLHELYHKYENVRGEFN